MTTYWWQNLLKGDIAEIICATHFKAAGWDVSETGIERIIPSFAQRDRGLDEVNASRIHEHIGYLPDLLVRSTEHGCYMVEVKFRRNITTFSELDEFLVKLLWKYKNLLFRYFDGNLFTSISFDEWNEPVRDDGKNSNLAEIHGRFKSALGKAAHRIDPDMIKLPLLFYVLCPSSESSPNVHLAYPRFSEEVGFTYVTYSLHDASRGDSNPENIPTLVSRLRETWQTDIRPALDCMFSSRTSAGVDAANAAMPSMADQTIAGISSQPSTENEFMKMLRDCVRRLVKKSGRKGAYLKDILDDAEFWDKLATIGVRKCSSLKEIKDLFDQHGITVEDWEPKGERYYVEQSSLKR